MRPVWRHPRKIFNLVTLHQINVVPHQNGFPHLPFKLARVTCAETWCKRGDCAEALSRRQRHKGSASHQHRNTTGAELWRTRSNALYCAINIPFLDSPLSLYDVPTIKFDKKLYPVSRSQEMRAVSCLAAEESRGPPQRVGRVILLSSVPLKCVDWWLTDFWITVDEIPFGFKYRSIQNSTVCSDEWNQKEEDASPSSSVLQWCRYWTAGCFCREPDNEAS